MTSAGEPRVASDLRAARIRQRHGGPTGKLFGCDLDARRRAARLLQLLGAACDRPPLYRTLVSGSHVFRNRRLTPPSAVKNVRPTFCPTLIQAMSSDCVIRCLIADLPSSLPPSCIKGSFLTGVEWTVERPGIVRSCMKACMHSLSPACFLSCMNGCDRDCCPPQAAPHRARVS